jgi:hypothetical protein
MRKAMIRSGMGTPRSQKSPYFIVDVDGLRIENPADDRDFVEIPMRGTTRELA